MSPAPFRLAVLGSPIAHSRSPALHAAAYRVLGLDWSYERAEVTSAEFPAFLESRNGSWRGLSLTMPLKRDVLALLDWRDETSALVGAANTVLFDAEDGIRSLRGFNTDVYGIVAALAEAEVRDIGSAWLLGSGATAASALVAVHRLGATLVTVFARTPANATPLRELGRSIGVDVRILALGERPGAVPPDVVVSTLPGGVRSGLDFPRSVRAGSVLLDVAYEPWPSELAQQWLAADGVVVPGILMLLHQALAQVRVFVAGDAETPLPDEPAVLAAMRVPFSG